MKRRILVTGSRGIVGNILCNQLRNEYEVISLDLPECDLRASDNLDKQMHGVDTVIHLAWNTETDNARSGVVDTENSRMFLNVYRNALAFNVRRIIMASSVHVHSFADSAAPISPNAAVTPNNLYGAHKLFMEAAGRYYATQGLEVVCLRLGGVTPDDSLIPSEETRYLSHRDLGSLVKTCIEVDSVPGNFTVLWATSHAGAQHYDLDSPFGWRPQD